LSSLLSACATTVDSSNSIEFEEIDQQFADLESKLSEKITRSCDQNIDALSKQLEEYSRAKTRTKVVNQCSDKDLARGGKKNGARDIGNKFILGSVEKVRLTKEDIKFDARIDTGAVTSSIGVFNMQRFERDGKKWVKFSLNETQDAQVYEYPISDTIKIKQSRTISEDRVEIKVDIEMGGVSYKKQLFNLADRSHLDYQLLIGRSFLRDIAVVDVGRKMLLRTN
jgi:Uncharacterized protein conserved in archaea